MEAQSQIMESQILLKHTEGEYKYCFIQYDKQNDYDTFIVEFTMGADTYDKLYWWGREEDKSIIGDFFVIVKTPNVNKKNEWRKIDLKRKYNIVNFDKIVQKALKEVESLKECIKR